MFAYLANLGLIQTEGDRGRQRLCCSKDVGESQQTVLLKGAGRALGLINASDGTPITDVKVLVGFFLSETYTPLVELALMHPKFYWAADLLEGLCTYINSWLWKLKKMMIKGEPGPLDKYKECLELLLTELKSGHKKRCNEFKEKAFRAKAKDDLHGLKNFPSIKGEIQPAVKTAFLSLKSIGEQYIGKSTMPPKTLALANAIICGAWEYNTFMGRKWEIEHCLSEDMIKVLEELREYLLCQQHKTCKTYGDVIKYLTQGLIEALKVYKDLPKPPSKYFLVPVSPAAETISFPRCLNTFNRKFLKEAKVSPTCNQVRKIFHKKLMELTKHEDALKDLMTQLDAHGRKVQDKHYIIRDPDDDLALAKTLVEKVLGETVPWPADETSLEQDLGELMEGIDPDVQDEENHEDADADDEPFDTWACGAVFGIREPGELDLIPLPDVDMPLPDDTEEQPKKEKKEKKEKNEKKEKKEKKEKQEKDEQKEQNPIKDDINEEDINEEEDPGYKKELYDKYPHDKSPSGKRSKISPEVHAIIFDYLKKWQQKFNKGPLEMPFRGTWCWNLRCFPFKENHLTLQHSWSACKNSVRDKVTALGAEMKANVEDVD